MRFQAVSVFAVAAMVVLFSFSASAENPRTAIIPDDGTTGAGIKAGRADVCQIGPGLGSTLLYPYFEVDLADPNGVTTLIPVNSGLAGGSLTRLVMWTDWGIPTMAFDIYLKGFDVQTINVRSLLDGLVPVTGVG